MNPAVTVVDYGAGNVGSVLNMLKKIGIPAARAVDPATLLYANRLILPGVGAFGHCMALLDASGLREALDEAARHKKLPVLGICAGFQMMFARSEEADRPGLGWLEGDVARFDPSKLSGRRKIPHMGWSHVETKPHALFANFDRPRFYFVHSYHVRPREQDALGFSEYGYRFCASAGSGNVAGVQFHPEKSHRFGMQLLKNFVGWQP